MWFSILHRSKLQILIMSLQLQVQQLQRNLDIRDRRYKFKTYKQCFIGADAIKVMISLNLASNVDEAIVFGNKLIESNMIQHVTKEHSFKNEKLFYRFTDEYYNTNSYKSTLNDLNLLSPPNILFNDINAFITNIQHLSKCVVLCASDHLNYIQITYTENILWNGRNIVNVIKICDP